MRIYLIRDYVVDSASSIGLGSHIELSRVEAGRGGVLFVPGHLAMVDHLVEDALEGSPLRWR